MASETNSYNMKQGLPNKMLNEDGTTTDLFGKIVQNPSKSWENKQALPNKWLNPDGTYSTLKEIIGGSIDSDIFVVVDELPEEGNPKKIYLLPDGNGGFIEYHYINGKWDIVGDINIDLSNYPTKQEMTKAINNALQEAKRYTDTSITGALNNSY